MKKISIYTKSGERAATAYYRIYQYIRNIKGTYRYRKMLPDKMYRRVMPISSRNPVEKVVIFLYIIFRVFGQLFKDYIDRPNILILSRRFVNRVFPLPYKWILNRLKKKGTKIIWDFDDEIIASKEVTRKGFDYISALSDYIVVASPINKKMISSKYHEKVIVVPTTDGDMFNLFTDEVTANRLKRFDSEIRLVWVGTSVNLQHVEKICPYLDNFAEIMSNKYGKQVSLTIVSNRPLVVNTLKCLILRNIKWERNIAISEMLNSHIGLMPLEDNKFTKGKGGFKLIQYLSVGLPIVGSPVGINQSIISSEVGFQVIDYCSDQWGEVLEKICREQEKWLTFSMAAHVKWQREYSYTNNLKFWTELLS